MRCRWPGVSLWVFDFNACWHIALACSSAAWCSCACRSLGKAEVRRLGQPGEGSRQNVDALILALHSKDPLEELQACTPLLPCAVPCIHILRVQASLFREIVHDLLHF